MPIFIAHYYNTRAIDYARPNTMQHDNSAFAESHGMSAGAAKEYVRIARKFGIVQVYEIAPPGAVANRALTRYIRGPLWYVHLCDEFASQAVERVLQNATPAAIEALHALQGKAGWASIPAEWWVGP